MPLRTDGVAQETEALGADGKVSERRSLERVGDGEKSIVWSGSVYRLATEIASVLTLAECVELGRCLLEGRRAPATAREEES